MKPVAPKEGVGDEEIADFVAAIVENECAPILMGSATGVFVFVKGGAVKAGQGPFIAREVRGNPIEQDADAGAVQLVDEILKIVGVPKRLVGA